MARWRGTACARDRAGRPPGRRSDTRAPRLGVEGATLWRASASRAREWWGATSPPRSSPGSSTRPPRGSARPSLRPAADSAVAGADGIARLGALVLRDRRRLLRSVGKLGDCEISPKPVVLVSCADPPRRGLPRGPPELQGGTDRSRRARGSLSGSTTTWSRTQPVGAEIRFRLETSPFGRAVTRSPRAAALSACGATVRASQARRGAA